MPSNAMPNPDDIVIHPMRQKQILKLYLEFQHQHQKGLCKVARFEQLLKLMFPTEDRAHIEAMARHVATRVAQQVYIPS